MINITKDDFSKFKKIGDLDFYTFKTILNRKMIFPQSTFFFFNPLSNLST